MKLKNWIMTAAAGAMLQLGVVHATDTKTIVKADNKEDFGTVVVAVHQEMQPGGRYQYATVKERTEIDTHLTDMQSLFDKFGTVAAMDERSKTQLFNDQEAVNATLTHRDGQRLICESVAPTGSNIPRRTCRTYSQMEQQRRDSQNMMDRMQRTNQRQGGG